MDGLIAFSHQFATPEGCLSYLGSVRWKRANFARSAVLRKRYTIIKKAYSL